MDLKTALGGDMSKKKVPKGAFHGPASGFFTQKKKVVLGNVKHSGDKKNISLSKSGSNNNTYSDVNSLSEDNKDVGMTGVNSESLLDLAITTPKTKHINTSAAFGSLLGFPNFDIDDDEEVKVSVRQSFALDINFSAVKGKLATAKTQFIRKNFSTINSFGRATTSSKFEGIIQLMFISEESLIKATSLARERKIIVNSDLKKQGIHLNWTVIIKKILMNMPKEIIIITVSEFADWYMAEGCGRICRIGTGKVTGIKMALLFILPVETIVHNFGTLLEGTGEKTCVINYSLETDNQNCCTIVSFESKNELESAFHTESIFGGIRLSWARLDLVWCKSVSSPATSTPLVLYLDVDMVLDDMMLTSASSFLAVDNMIHGSSSSFFKVLISKIDGLESKIVAFEFSIGSVLERLDHLCSGLVFTSGLESGYLGADITIIMNASLTKHVCKVSEVSVLGLYVGATLEKRLAHLHIVNSMVAKALNGNTFVVLGSDFNENDSGHSPGFRKCLDLGLLDSLHSSSLYRLPTWSNSRGVQRCIDFILVSDGFRSSSFNQRVYCPIEFFDSDYLVILVDIGLRGLLDSQLNSIHKQAMKKKWRYKVSNINGEIWKKFEDALLAAASKATGDFEYHKTKVNINRMDNKLVKTAISFRFHKLELLVVKILNAYKSKNLEKFQALVNRWADLDLNQAMKFKSSLGNSHDKVLAAIDKHMKAFANNKDQMIRIKPFVPSCWQEQFSSLIYVNDGVFFGMMKQIDFDEFLFVVKDLPNGKAAGSVVKDALEKGRKLWLVLQDMCKAYDLVGWLHLKSSLERIKMCDRYQVDSKFVARMDKIESNAGLTSYLAAGAFVDNTI
ncbi:hypothetical protein G9A89_022453 [Geosiphon pyriformis]|nr:hypothetical protein G9A89_022453 [Geosiphon pyriformis]